MQIGIPHEVQAGERRVAVTAGLVPLLREDGPEVLVEMGAGVGAQCSDSLSLQARARLFGDAAALYEQADVLLKVQPPQMHPRTGLRETEMVRAGSAYPGFLASFTHPHVLRAFARRQMSVFAMDLVPRLTRVQSMDALSSMATVAGSRGGLLATAYLGKMFPLLMTAAGTIAPATVLVLGAGMAGLQAIATARRPDARVEAFNARPAAREQILSLGATALEMEVLQDVQSAAFLKQEQEVIRARLPGVDVLKGAFVAAYPADVSHQRVPWHLAGGIARGNWGRPGGREHRAWDCSGHGCDHQRGRWLSDHRSHAQDVSLQRGGAAMNEVFWASAYLASALLFVQGLKAFNASQTARRGLLLAELVGVVEYDERGPTLAPGTMAALGFEVLFGSLTITGSLLAFGKMQALVKSALILYRFLQVSNAQLFAVTARARAALIVCPATGVLLLGVLALFNAYAGASVLFGAVGAMRVETGQERTVTRYAPQDAAYILAQARSVSIVHGYGLALAQAHYAVQDLAELLMAAEARVPYDLLYEPERINDDFQGDVRHPGGWRKRCGESRCSLQESEPALRDAHP